MNIEVGKDYAEVDCTMGVHQGDNMPLILFLFIIQTFLDTNEFKTQPDNFAWNRDELYEAVGVLNNHFSRFGLKMHLGLGTSKSKSEAMFFPTSLKEAQDAD